MTFISSKKQIKKLPLSSDLESKDPSMYKRLQYAKEILIQMINKNDPKPASQPKEQQTDRQIYKTTQNPPKTDRTGNQILESTHQPMSLLNSISQNFRNSELQAQQSHRGTMVQPSN